MADTTAQKSMVVPLTAFAAGAVVALLLGVFGRVHDPTLAGTTSLGFRTVIDMKVVLSTVIGILAVAQVIGGLWIYGKLGIKAPAWLGTAHFPLAGAANQNQLQFSVEWRQLFDRMSDPDVTYQFWGGLRYLFR